MALSRDTLHLLLLTNTQNDAESLVSLIRNSGSATRAQSITSLASFAEMIQEKNWDIVVAEPSACGITYEELLNQIQRLNKDLPLILIPRDADPMQLETALQRGAAAVVPFDESNIIMLTIQRELNNLMCRRDLRILQVRLRETEKRCRNLLESSKDAIAYVYDGMHVYANTAYLDLFGYDSVEELEGMPIMDMVAGNEQKTFKSFLKNYQTDPLNNSELHTIGVDPNGLEFPMGMSFSAAMYADEMCTQVVIQQEEKHEVLEAEIDELRIRDIMTGLYNKPHFADSLASVIDRAVMLNESSALLYINVDGFGRVKRDIGIQHSDDVVCAVADCLKEHITDDDIVARIGEDVFGWLTPISNPEAAQKLAQELCDAIAERLIEVDSRTVQVTTSIGITLINSNSPNPEDALQQAHVAADAVRQQAGHEHGNGVSLFMLREDVTPAGPPQLEQQLASALKANHLRLLFQPLISLRGEDLEHYEALLRLPTNSGEDISAGEFLNTPHISDELKRKIDRWVIIHTTKLLSEHHRKGHKTRVFINISAASLRDDTLANWIVVAMKAAGLASGSVIFQFNEDDAGQHLAQAKRFAYGVRRHGMLTAISRFGCALVPMQTLEHIDVDYVKVDGSFTQELAQNPAAQKHLKTLLADIHSAGKISIVPLVESAASVSSIWQMGVHFIQGYYVQGPQAGMTYDFSDEASTAE
ncbi:MAG: diguanylate cyclase (GGDEF)-like protein/PAS domain S-box-containing protein [Gammaproteobacteria bacterium]|jgi:diguanylate cyclase (GGDEF)-like protein/PAS domain S-box-containing protein|uniref:EAL domain-containing protein n=1 Tax=Thalassolituus oleivorans TaxID=187493 RepID=UPI0023F46723|nr:EAL domain-containing protein [Thalassolituus oleivorans]